jgi:hypothetical protein
MHLALIYGALGFDYLKFSIEICVVKTKKWNNYSYPPL